MLTKSRVSSISFSLSSVSVLIYKDKTKVVTVLYHACSTKQTVKQPGNGEDIDIKRYQKNKFWSSCTVTAFLNTSIEMLKLSALETKRL